MRPLGRNKGKREDSFKMELEEIGYEDVDWIIWARVGTSSRLLCTV
jgi:hypothetical protein